MNFQELCYVCKPMYMQQLKLSLESLYKHDKQSDVTSVSLI